MNIGRASDADSSAALNLTPLIDVVFQLLVFFLLTSAFISTGITVELPDAETGEAGDETTLAISLDAEGAIFVGSEEVSLEALDGVLAVVTAAARPQDCLQW